MFFFICSCLLKLSIFVHHILAKEFSKGPISQHPNIILHYFITKIQTFNLYFNFVFQFYWPISNHYSEDIRTANTWIYLIIIEWFWLELSRMEKTCSFLKAALPGFYFILLHFISRGEHASVLNQAQAILFFIW